MNKIELSILDSLNGVTSRNGNWKLFANRNVKSNLKLNEKEVKVYAALTDYLSNKDTSISVLPCDKFTSSLIDWSNEKLIELPSVLVDIKTLEKCLKYYWLENHLTLNRYFCIAMNNKEDRLYIVSVCRESAIYRLKESEEEGDQVATSEEEENLNKINDHINSILKLSGNMSESEKVDIVKNLEKVLGVNATVTLIKNKATA